MDAYHKGGGCFPFCNIQFLSVSDKDNIVTNTNYDTMQRNIFTQNKVTLIVQTPLGHKKGESSNNSLYTIYTF